MVSFKLIERSLGLISTIILARLLVPADFGLVAMAMVLIGALQLLISFSFDVSLIQNPSAGRDQFDTAWTFNALFATVCGVVLALMANLAADFYHEPRLESVIFVLAIGFVVQGLSNIGPVIFRREMRFDREFKFLLSKRLATLTVTIPLAFYLKNYWALVIGQLSGAVLSAALSYLVSNYRPRFSFKARTELFHISKWLMVSNLLHFLNGRAAEFVIGRISGAQTLGIYTIASEISTLPTTELVAPINRAAFPGYCRAAGDIDQLRNSFLNVISTIALFSFPAGIGIASVADLLVPAILGWKWQATVPLIQILAIYGLIQALQTNTVYVYMALGNVRLFTLIGSIQFLILLILLVFGIKYWAVTGAAWAFLGTVIVMIPVNQVLVSRCLKLSSTHFCISLVRPFIASLAVSGSIWIIKQNLALQHAAIDYLLALILCISVGIIVYTCVLYGLWRISSRPEGPERFCFLQVESMLFKLGIKVNLVGEPI